jgi:exosortase
VTNFHTLTSLSILVIILGLSLSFMGWQFTKELLLPVLFLLFMFPIPSHYYVLVTHPLKLFVTKVSEVVINGLGISVYREGNLLFFGSTQLEVAEACSGLRSFYSYLMLSCVFAVISQRLRTKIVLIVSTAFLAVMINVFRVTITGILASYVGAKASEGFFHEFSGIVLFVVGFMIFFFEYIILEKKTANNRIRNN